MQRRAFLAGLLALAAAPAAARIAAIVAPAAEPLAEIDGANQYGFQLYIGQGLSQPLMVGDIITISGVNSPDGSVERQFVITAAVAEGERIINIYPPIHPAHVEPHYATVDKAPANRAEVKLVEWGRPERRQEPFGLGMSPIRREVPA